MAVRGQATRLLEILAGTGFGAALVHGQRQVEEARDTAYALMLLRGCALALLALVAAPFVNAFHEQPAVDSLICVIGVCFSLLGSSQRRPTKRTPFGLWRRSGTSA